ncbi:MAG: hypothetical protein HC784_13055, partial [Hydrococcus sp. CSU_1_8]|nr:hypothetical protein [Hydrococcus sp. CSU_1_8]
MGDAVGRLELAEVERDLLLTEAVIDQEGDVDVLIGGLQRRHRRVAGRVELVRNGHDLAGG